jgi:hypothetical protein
MLDSEITSKILEMTNQQLYAVKGNIYKETLRQLVHIFGNIYYVDGNGQKLKIKCSTGRQERAIGKQKKDNTLILPYITVVELETSNADSRRRYQPILVSEKIWDNKERRAKRLLSLAPRPVDLGYQINIWTKYQEDMDMIKYSIFSLFNPDLEIRTSFSDITKAFLESDTNIGEPEALDTADRSLKRSLVIKVETYLPSPKFLFTNTGEITAFNAQVELFGLTKDMEEDDPDETVILEENLS